MVIFAFTYNGFYSKRLGMHWSRLPSCGAAAEQLAKWHCDTLLLSVMTQHASAFSTSATVCRRLRGCSRRPTTHRSTTPTSTVSCTRSWLTRTNWFNSPLPTSTWNSPSPTSNVHDVICGDVVLETTVQVSRRLDD